MRADLKLQPPSIKSWRATKSGRYKYYRAGCLMEVWLFIRERMERTKLSANQVCLNSRFTFFVLGRGGESQAYTVAKQTLRSLYQRANRIVQQEQQMYDEFVLALRRVGASSTLEGLPLPTATAWNQELQRRLAGPA